MNYEVTSSPDSPVQFSMKSTSTNQSSVKKEVEQKLLSLLLNEKSSDSLKTKNLALKIQHMEKEHIIPKPVTKQFKKTDLTDEMLQHVISLYELPLVSVDTIREVCFLYMTEQPIPSTYWEFITSQLQQGGYDTEDESFYAPNLINSICKYMQNTLRNEQIQDYAERISFSAITDAMYQCNIISDPCFVRFLVAEYLLYGEKAFFESYDESDITRFDVADIVRTMKAHIRT